MTVNALCSFDSIAAAQHAVDALTAAGLARSAVRLHAHRSSPHEAVTTELDEVATGGLISNMTQLLEGVFEWGASPHEASAFEATVRRGGAVLSIDVQSAEERARADSVLSTAGYKERSTWRQKPNR